MAKSAKIKKSSRQAKRGRNYTVGSGAYSGRSVSKRSESTRGSSGINFWKANPIPAPERIKLSRDGIKVDAFFDLVDELNSTNKELAENLKINISKLGRKKATGALLGQLETEKLIRLNDVFIKSVELFRNEVDAVDWLKAPQHYLGNVTPLSLCDTEAGANEVIKLIGRIRHGVLA